MVLLVRWVHQGELNRKQSFRGYSLTCYFTPCQFFGDMCQIFTSLVVKAIIRFSTDHYNARRNGTETPSIGRGVGLCVGLFCMLIFSSVSVNHFFLRSAGTGVLARAALISSLYERESF
jgi:hypothetical protein